MKQTSYQSKTKKQGDSTFPRLIERANLCPDTTMSKAIDDPIIISVPSDYIQESRIRSAIASSANDYCCECNHVV